MHIFWLNLNVELQLYFLCTNKICTQEKHAYGDALSLGVLWGASAVWKQLLCTTSGAHSGLNFSTDYFRTTILAKSVATEMEPVISVHDIYLTDTFLSLIICHIQKHACWSWTGQTVKTMSGGSILHIEGRIKRAKAPWLYVLGHLLNFYGCLTNSWRHLFLQLPSYESHVRHLWATPAAKWLDRTSDGNSEGNFAQTQHKHRQMLAYVGLLLKLRVKAKTRAPQRL